MVLVVPLFSTEHLKGKILALSQELRQEINVIDKIWDRKSEVICRCGGDEKTERPRRTDNSRTLKKTPKSCLKVLLKSYITLIVSGIIKNKVQYFGIFVRWFQPNNVSYRSINLKFNIGQKTLENTRSFLTLKLKGCDSNFKVYFVQILKVATNETTTLH